MLDAGKAAGKQASDKKAVRSSIGSLDDLSDDDVFTPLPNRAQTWHAGGQRASGSSAAGDGPEDAISKGEDDDEEEVLQKASSMQVNESLVPGQRKRKRLVSCASDSE